MAFGIGKAKRLIRRKKNNKAMPVDGTIEYLNTDLDLTSAGDLSALTAEFEARGAFTLYNGRGDEGRCSARFEISSDVSPHEPDQTIAALLDLVESLPESLSAIWSGCEMREFNIGYDCGHRPWAFNQGLSSAILARLAAAGASLRITIYPEEREEEPRDNPMPVQQPDPQ